MDILNIDFASKTSVIQALYDALKKNENSSFTSVYTFEQVHSQKNILEKMVYLIDQVSKKFPNSAPVQALLPSTSIAQKESNHKIADEGTTPSEVLTILASSTISSQLFNEQKQAWATQIVTKIKPEVDVMITTASQAGDSAVTERKNFEAIRNTFTQLLAAQNWSEQQYLSMYQAVKSFIEGIQNSNLLAGDRKSGRLGTIGTILGDQDQFVQTFAKIRATSLANILSEAKSHLPESESTFFQEFEVTINKLTALTAFSDNDLQELFQAFQQFYSLVRQSPMSNGDKVEACNQAMSVYTDLIQALSMYDHLAQASLENQERILTLFTTVSQWTQSVMSLFAPTNMGFIANLTPDLLLRGLHLIRMIELRFSELTASQRQVINTCLECLSTSGIVKYLGAVWTYLLASQTVASQPNITMTDLNTAIRTLASNASPASSTFVLSAGLKNTVYSVASNDGLFNPGAITTFALTNLNATPRSFDLPIYMEDNGKMVIDTEFFQSNASASVLLGSVSSLMKQNEASFLAKYNTFLTQQQTEQTSLQSQIQQKEQAANQLQELTNNYSENQVVLQKLGLQVYSLPGAFVSILVDHYMPKEVAYLDSLNKLLYFSNLGSEIGNSLMEATSTYIHGASYFNFGSFVGQQPVVGQRGANEYPGSAETAKEKLKTEKEQVEKYLKSTRDAEAVINQQMNKVLNDTTISPKQREELIGKLNTYTENLQVILSSLLLLQNFLQPLTIQDGPLAGTFVVSGGKNDWRSQLETLEENVISGMTGQMTGGLFTFQAFLQSEQQSYADMGQNHQLELQMHLTSMQQEWTMVSTSLQLLNQMYLSLARSFLG